MWKQLLVVATNAVVLAGANPLKNIRQTVQGVTNGLGLGRDPSPFSQVVSGTRTYYFPQTLTPSKSHPNGGLVTLQIGTNLETVLTNQAYNYTIFATDAFRPNDAGFFQNGTNGYIITVASADASDGIFTLQNNGRDLTRNWRASGPIMDKTNNVMLVGYDTQAFTVGGTNYLLYAHDGNSVFIAKFTSPTTVENPTQIVDYNLESPKPTGAVEAPGALVSGDTVNIFWSDNQYYTPTYNVRRLSVKTSANLLSSSTWSGLTHDTILQSDSTKGVNAPGSAAVFTGPDGKSWLAYSCYYGSGSFTPPRKVQIQPIPFNGNVMASMTVNAPSPSRTSFPLAPQS